MCDGVRLCSPPIFEWAFSWFYYLHCFLEEISTCTRDRQILVTLGIFFSHFSIHSFAGVEGDTCFSSHYHTFLQAFEQAGIVQLSRSCMCRCLPTYFCFQWFDCLSCSSSLFFVQVFFLVSSDPYNIYFAEATCKLQTSKVCVSFQAFWLCWKWGYNQAGCEPCSLHIMRTMFWIKVAS